MQLDLIIMVHFKHISILPMEYGDFPFGNWVVAVVAYLLWERVSECKWKD